MAQKKITDLTLIAAVLDGLSIPADDGIQTYRATALQMKNYILPDAGITRAKLALGAVANLVIQSKSSTYTALATDDVLLCDTSGGAFTVTLPPSAANAGKVLHFKLYPGGSALTIDGDGSETIDGATTFVLWGKSDYCTLICDGTQWLVYNMSIGNGVMVRGSSNTANSISANTTNITWTEDYDPQSVWNGNTLSALPYDALISVTGALSLSGPAAASLYFAINGTLDKALNTAYASISTHSFSGSILLPSGSTLSIRSTSGVTLNISTANHYINIAAKRVR